jgi:hypothetical protein
MVINDQPEESLGPSLTKSRGDDHRPGRRRRGSNLGMKLRTANEVIAIWYSGPKVVQKFRGHAEEAPVIIRATLPSHGVLDQADQM